jgi:hypothetical protein
VQDHAQKRKIHTVRRGFQIVFVRLPDTDGRELPFSSPGPQDFQHLRGNIHCRDCSLRTDYFRGRQAEKADACADVDHGVSGLQA